MTSTLVDSNVLIDLLDSPGETGTWSSKRIEEAGNDGKVVLSPIVLAEISIGFDDLLELDRLLSRVGFTRETLPWEAAFKAGKAHADYRRRGGVRDRTLPDFLIGAHAVVKGHHLLTRDPRRYRSYFRSYLP